MRQWIRTYRFSAGRAGGDGFEVGETTRENHMGLHIKFIIEKADTETPNTARIVLWNLNPEQLAILAEEDCVAVLRAGYNTFMPLCFVGGITYLQTERDRADRKTTLEAADGRIELRDTFVSLSYAGLTNSQTVIDAIAAHMGVTVTYSYNATFHSFPNGWSCVGPARTALDKACSSSGLQWGMYNGVLQVKRARDTMTREVYVLSPDSGLLSVPKKIIYGKDDAGAGDQSGWEVEYFLNGAIGIGDYIRLESEAVRGYFRMKSLVMDGDNIDGDWICTAKLIEA